MVIPLTYNVSGVPRQVQTSTGATPQTRGMSLLPEATGLAKGVGHTGLSVEERACRIRSQGTGSRRHFSLFSKKRQGKLRVNLPSMCQS